jgi:hypothetical protein
MDFEPEINDRDGADYADDHFLFVAYKSPAQFSMAHRCLIKEAREAKRCWDRVEEVVGECAVKELPGDVHLSTYYCKGSLAIIGPVASNIFLECLS